MQLDEIVPWGRTGLEYQQMFNLTDVPFGSRILSCGDGPSSFNVDAREQGYQVTSFDPIYQFDHQSLSQRISQVRDEIMSQIRQNTGDYVWESITSPDELQKIRMGAMSVFLSDFEKGCLEGRYVAGSAPTFPFASDSFDLALSSHFLFLYSQQFSFSKHIAAIKELMRMAKEVRIYPLLAIHNNQVSEHLDGAMTEMQNDGFSVELCSVPYEFQKGATKMLQIKR